MEMATHPPAQVLFHFLIATNSNEQVGYTFHRLHSIATIVGRYFHEDAGERNNTVKR